MTAHHHQDCLCWCQHHMHWNLNMWRNVMFSEESSLIIGSKCGKDADNTMLIAAPLEYHLLVEAV